MTKDDMALSNTTTNTVDAQASQGVPETTTTTTTRESTMIINAFHPDYMKTYHPNFMTDFRTVEANQEERKIKEPRKVIRKPRALERATKRVVQTKAQRAVTMAEVTAELLKTTTFHIYSKAGAKK